MVTSGDTACGQWSRSHCTCRRYSSASWPTAVDSGMGGWERCSKLHRDVHLGTDPEVDCKGQLEAHPFTDTLLLDVCRHRSQFPLRPTIISWRYRDSTQGFPWAEHLHISILRWSLARWHRRSGHRQAGLKWLACWPELWLGCVLLVTFVV